MKYEIKKEVLDELLQVSQGELPTIKPGATTKVEENQSDFQGKTISLSLFLFLFFFELECFILKLSMSFIIISCLEGKKEKRKLSRLEKIFCS